MKLRFQSTLAAFALLLVVSSMSFASPRDDAWGLRISNPEAAVSGLQQVVRDNPNDAKAQYYLAQLLNKMGRGNEGLEALEAAKRADPSLGFASSPRNVETIERSLRNKAGGAAPRPSASNAPGGGTSLSREQQAEIVRSLEATSVWVAPAMQNVADAGAISREIKSINRPVKVVVLDRLPGSTRNIGTFTRGAHGGLNISDGLLIVATGSPRAVAAYDGYNDTSLQTIVKNSAATFNSKGYAAGIGEIVRAWDASESSSERAGTMGLLFIIGVPAAGVWYFVNRSKKKRAAETVQLRNETRELSAQLAPQYEKLDSDFEYALLAEADPDRKRQLQEARSSAGSAFSAAMKKLNAAEDEYNQLAGARITLTQAKNRMQRSRNILEGKPEDEGIYDAPAPQLGANRMAGALNEADNDYEIAPIGADYPGARPGYALDFFTSQPVPIDEMVPVDIDVNGQSRRVWASRDSAQRAMNGEAQVATVPYQGQQVPWYGAPQQYNPWNDFGSSMLQMVAMNMMINSLFHPGYSTVHHYHHGDSYGNGGGNWDSGNNGSGQDNSNVGVADLDAPFWGSADDSGVASTSLDIFGNSGSSDGGFFDSGSDFGGGDFDGGGFDSGGFDGGGD
ncbi:MAG: hypothetical protein JWN98_1166 [Abditibacteriota bacterium]|nr:hypothetical protein [Abditibacteriota bacterium]